MRRPEPGTFEDRLRPVKVPISSIVRLSRQPATEPYWSTGVYRFDGPDAPDPGCFGTCYAAASIEVAFAETVIHESARFAHGRFEVASAELEARRAVYFTCAGRKTLLLADLTGANLKALGLNNDISASDDYAGAQAWARAVHGASPRWDGIRYVSRQLNRGFAYAIFQRSGVRFRKATRIGPSQRDVLCEKFNVVLV